MRARPARTSSPSTRFSSVTRLLPYGSLRRYFPRSRDAGGPFSTPKADETAIRSTQDATRVPRLLHVGAAQAREAPLRTEIAARTESATSTTGGNEPVTRKLGLLVSAFTLAASIVAAGASADIAPSLLGGNCGTTSQPFAPWNDSAAYYLAGNGGFESAGGWTLPAALRSSRATSPSTSTASRITRRSCWRPGRPRRAASSASVS